MSVAGRVFERIVAAAARRPVAVLVVVAALTAAGSALALRLDPSAATDTLVGRNSDTYQATERYRERFGDHSIIILVRGELQRIVLVPQNLQRLLGLEQCIGGNIVRDAPGGPRGPCGRFAAQKPVKVVYGPGTFINTAVDLIRQQLAQRLQAQEVQARRAARAARALARSQGKSQAEQDQLAEAARRASQTQLLQELLELSVRYGLGRRVPSIDDPDFIARVVFDARRGPDVPKTRFASLFPTNRAAVIQVRLNPSLSDEQRAEAIRNVRAAVAMKEWAPEGPVSYLVTGAPVLAEDLTDSLASSTVGLLLIALVVMAGVLAAVFRSRMRLLPLAVALAAVALVFGLMSLIGARLTMASIAVLPVLLGLGVDYAIQYQARVEEAAEDADPRAAALRATRLAVPTIATAGLATIVGFLVLLLSPVPMVRGFGLLLVAGIVFAFVLALSLGTAALVAGARSRRSGPLARSVRGAQELVAAAGGKVRRAVAGSPPGRGAARLGARIGAGVLRAARERPRRVLVIGLLLACAGWVVDSQTDVESDINRLVPQDLPALRDLNELQRATGVAGEVDVVVQGEDLTDPKAVAWMRDYQSKLLKAYGFSPERGCGQADLCSALSLPDLFRNPGATRRREDVRALLDAVPPYFSQAVITPDRKTATLAFGIKLLPLERQQEIMEDMRRRLRAGRPPGVRAELAGLPVLAAEANRSLSSPLRRLGTLAAGLLAVLLVLRLVYRRWDYALIPVVPIALATGWSALVLFALRVPLNPMSATLGALVIAISTEFSVLLSARFREERRRGYSAGESLRRTYRSTGAAVLASGTTAIAGFAVLGFSDVEMLQNFGRVTVVDLSVSLLGVLAVLPAVLLLADRRSPGRPRPRPVERPSEVPV